MKTGDHAGETQTLSVLHEQSATETLLPPSGTGLFYRPETRRPSCYPANIEGNSKYNNNNDRLTAFDPGQPG